MVPSDHVKGGRSHYACDLCGARSARGHLMGTMRRWRCERCDYDVCFQCHPQAPAPPGAAGRQTSPWAAGREAWAEAAGGGPWALAAPLSGGSALSAARHLRTSSAQYGPRPRVPASDGSGESGGSAEPAGPAWDRGRPHSAAPSGSKGEGARACQRHRPGSRCGPQPPGSAGTLPDPWRSSSAGSCCGRPGRR